jgi:predicted esterase
MGVRFVWLLIFAACSRRVSDPSPPPVASSASVIAPVPEASPPPEPVRVEPIHVPGDLDAYVLRGVRAREHPMIFLGGMCVHPQGYVMSFAHAAADHGVVIGLQGDLTCNGESSMSRWSYDIERTNRRIDEAFAAAGEPPPTDAIAIGLSQGADLAERLAARWPQKYTRVILIASPVEPKPQTAKAVLMAGNYDISQARMRAAAKRLGANATFISLGNAYHGQLGPTPNASLGAAIQFATAP